MVWLFKFMHVTVSYLNWIMYCKLIWCSQIIRKGFYANHETIPSAVTVILYNAYLSAQNVHRYLAAVKSIAK